MPNSNDNPGWTPDIARMLSTELRRTNEIQMELVRVLSDVRDGSVALVQVLSSVRDGHVALLDVLNSLRHELDELRAAA